MKLSEEEAIIEKEIIYDEFGFTATKPPDYSAGIPHKLSFSAWIVIVAELFERFAFYGATIMFTTFMIISLGIEKAASVTINRAFSFTVYFFTLLGGYLSDQYLGKYRTVVYFSTWYLIGMVLLTLSSVPSFSKSTGFAIFAVAIYVFVSIGSGSIKASMTTIPVDQIRTGYKPTETPGLYYDSKRTITRCYTFFYWAINLGALLGMIICPEVALYSNVGAFAIPAFLIVLYILLFVFFKKRLVIIKPKGSPFNKVYKCIKYARHHKSSTNQHWLDAAKGIQSEEWDDEFVEGLKRGFNACKVFLFYPFYNAIYINVSDSFINQGLQMKRPKWLQASMLSGIHCLAIIIIIPIFDIWLYPALAKRNIPMGPIKRMTLGFIFLVLTFVYITVLQKFIYSSAPFYDFTGKDVPINPHNDISIWWQVPLYIIISISEIFAAVTGLEYAYSQAPSELKSFLQAIFQFTGAIGSLIGMIISIWSYDPAILWSFAAQAIIFAIMTVAFWLIFHKYDAQTESQENSE
ncbi:hypothetical protein BB560_001930 [Smittium megazygosporum]|uniref:Major facilitator superfamily (MFS) profile domain-containing protein n=1 Tax=Smittium megazygosporum TaxID=133381 RepID=A0A2T9ZD69_9FUNG|nr:hypothetical protein BB560_003062 [Smittium megazygosporum]PVV03584.1 hypothetical protein BB560_001930 [Smittium megazygosporum]